MIVDNALIEIIKMGPLGAMVGLLLGMAAAAAARTAPVDGGRPADARSPTESDVVATA